MGNDYPISLHISVLSAFVASTDISAHMEPSGGSAVTCRFDARRRRCGNVSGCHGNPKAEWSDSCNGRHGSLMCDESLGEITMMRTGP